MDYTSAHERFEEKTPEDFEGEFVQLFGSGTESCGFGVLDDAVIIVTGSEQNGGYRVFSDIVLQSGDSIYIKDTASLVKIGSVTRNADGSLFVMPSEDATLQDFYQYLRYGESIDAVDALGVSAPVSNRGLTRGSIAKVFESSMDRGPFSGQFTASASVNCDIELDKALFPERYLKCEVYSLVSAHVEYTFSSEMEFKQEIPLFSGAVPTSVPGLLVELNVSIPLSLKAEAEASYSTDIYLKAGAVYSTDNGISPIREGNWTHQLQLEGKLTGTLGLRLDVDLLAMYVMDIGVGAEIGAKATATAKPVDYTSEEVDMIHACMLCFDFTVDRYIELDVHGSVHLPGDSGEGFSKSFPLQDDRLFDGYLSVLNEMESVHKGKCVLDVGECPNYKYRTLIKAFTEEGKERATFLELYGIDSSFHDTGITRCKFWLYPGAYEVGVDISHDTIWKSFLITNSAQEVVVQPDPKPTTTPVPTLTPTPAATTTPTPVKPTPGPAASEQAIRVVDTSNALVVVDGYVGIRLNSENFPDPYFRQYLKEHVDTDDKQWLLSWEERKSLQYIDTHSDSLLSSITDFTGIEYFPDLRQLRLSEESAVTSLDLSGISNWGYPLSVAVSCNSLTNLNLSGCNSLNVVSLHGCENLRSLNIRECPCLESATIVECGLTALALSGLPQLESLFLSNSKNLPTLAFRIVML